MGFLVTEQNKWLYSQVTGMNKLDYIFNTPFNYGHIRQDKNITPTV